jgi:hypothetical protein
MPALRELQRALGRALLAEAVTVAPAELAPAELALPSQLLAIYRNTCLGALTGALALSFPAVRRLVGSGFFETAAQEFIRTHPPTSACLNDYGQQFAAFLAQFPQAAQLTYLADVARLEWAVNRALHAPDVPGLQVQLLAGLHAAVVASLRFVPHPAVSVLRLDTPADAIWHAVLDQDQAAIAALDPAAGPVWLLIERCAGSVQVRRLTPAAWQFTQRLCAGEPLQAALSEAACANHAGEELNAVLNALLADHLASARFTGWIGEGTS